jgi:hypothetical protein
MMRWGGGTSTMLLVTILFFGYKKHTSLGGIRGRSKFGIHDDVLGMSGQSMRMDRRCAS